MSWLTGLRDPWTDEAMALELDSEGRIARIARLTDGAFPSRGASECTDLRGQYVLPGFIDSHCHILPMGLDFQKLHLGACTSPDEVLDAVRQRHADLPGNEWLHAVHYDQTKFASGEHLHRSQLDAISPDRPILLRHVNGHASVANTAALVAAGVTPATEDPKGGTFVRDASGELTGVLLERAHEAVTQSAPEPTLSQMVEAILEAGVRMSQLGITAATDMMTGRWNLARELEAYHLAAEQGCRVRLRMYVQWATRLGPRGLAEDRWSELISAMKPELCAVLGLKIFADGAIGSATAAVYEPFPDGSLGTLIYEPDRLNQMVLQAAEAGYAVAIHSIGDRSTDLVMDAFAATSDPTRHRLEHAMILSDAQLDRLRQLDCRVTMQPEFLLRFGHSYQRQLGPERAYRLKRMRSVLDAGLRLSLSSDRPIVAGDPWDGIRSAVQRPEGFDPAEALTWAEAVGGYTRAGAEANDDAGTQGELAPGCWADFQLYAENPLQRPSHPQQVWRAGKRITS